MHRCQVCNLAALRTGVLLAVALSALAACAATDPDPSPRFDGRYVGTRISDSAKDCGIAEIRGSTSASVAHGHLTMPLFGSKTMLAGTVGDNGRVRASGIWPNPTGGYPGVTVLNGAVEDDWLNATASDFRCHTDVRLRKAALPAAVRRRR